MVAVVAAAALSAVAGCTGGEATPPERPASSSRFCPDGKKVTNIAASEGRAYPSVKRAMAPLIGPRERLDVGEIHSGTARALVRRRDGAVTLRADLLEVGSGWVRTRVVRCR